MHLGLTAGTKLSVLLPAGGFGGKNNSQEHLLTVPIQIAMILPAVDATDAKITKQPGNRPRLVKLVASAWRAFFCATKDVYVKPVSDDVKQLFTRHCNYCPATGQLRLQDPAYVYVDDRKTCKYLCVQIGKEKILAHRICWLLFTGELPTLAIDHINGDGLDNRIANLRLATSAENMRNKQRYRKSTVKFPGITLQETKRGTAYRAQVGVSGKCKHGPTRYSLIEAINDRIELLNQHGYSKRHVDAHVEPLLRHVAEATR